MNQRLCKTTGYLLSTLACAISTQVYAEPAFRCVTGSDGSWVCGPEADVSAQQAAPLPATPPQITASPTRSEATVVSEPTATAAVPAAPPQPQVGDETITPESVTSPDQAEKTVVTEQATTATTKTAQQQSRQASPTSIPRPQTSKTKAAAMQCATAPRVGPPPVADRANQVTTISADEMEVRDRNQFIYRGSVELQRADQSLTTDQAQYNHETGLFEAEGNLRYREYGTEISGDRGTFNAKSDQGAIENASYRMSESNANGEAAIIEQDGAYVSRYHQATYSTCDPKERSWQLEASEIEMDELEGWGSAKDAIVRFKGVPILYTPSYTFPLDERRKSGFLFPSMGYDDVGGGDFSAPYYWNIAPNRDATLTPRSIGRRGVMLSGNFRYLNSNSSGQIDGSFLPSDDLYGDDRYQLKVDHQGTVRMDQLANEVDYSIDYSMLSDTQYLSHFGNNLSLASTNTLEQTANVSYSQDRWKLSALLSDHYNISADSEPYRRLPQVDGSWSSEAGNNQLNYGIEGQFVYFEHSATSKPNAERYWMKPSIHYNHTMLNDALFIKPTLSVAQSHYELDTGTSSSMTVPHYTLETGLFLEREATDTFALLGGTKGYLQALEPQLKFSYIPDGKNSGQEFDVITESGNNSFDLSEFHGKDSAPHTKQVTWTVNNSWTRETDHTKIITASLEQTRDFKSSRTRNWSNLVAKANTDFGPHDTRLELNWDPYDNWNDSTTAGYQFNNDKDKVLNIDYHFSQNDSGVDQKKQIDLSAAWALNSRWDLFARYNQELGDSSGLDYRLEDLIGVSYESCCWAANFTRRKTLTGSITADNPYNTTWFLVLELKGLGKLGKKSGTLDEQLQKSIKGYKIEE